MNDFDALRQAMVEQMTAAGTLRSPQWTHAFAAVPRHLFLPRFFRQTADHSGWWPVGDSDPGWVEMVYTDTTWVTQLDNDPTRWDTTRVGGHPTRGVPTSSSTAPGLMALMLETLDIYDGQNVLEIGTGTGYNTALLSHRAGSHLVTTVEVDPTVAQAARLALLACGYTPTLVVDDGTAGHPDRGPYDRIIATCSTATIPPAWTAQLRTGGLLLTNLHRDLAGGALALLHRDDGGELTGPFLPDYGAFMPVRADPAADAGQRLTSALATLGGGAPARPTGVSADALDHPHFGMIAALRLPGVASLWFEPDTGPQRWLLADDGSWACVEETTHTVTQHGTRRLWDEVEHLHQQWTDADNPPRHRYGLTVTDAGTHQFWLDEPSHVCWITNEH